MTEQKIIYTWTDEAPYLATHSLLPVIKAYAGVTGVNIETKDISLAARILAQFADRLPAAQKTSDDLAELGAWAKTPHANIIKLPNISASIPQLNEAIAELQGQGYKIPDYVDVPKNDDERDTKARYSKVLGSAVNPVLREGNSDRRVAPPVKEYAKKHPHSMGAWSKDSQTHVAHMQDDDFFGSEQSIITKSAGHVRIEFVGSDGKTTILKEKTALQAGEVFDSSRLRVAKLRDFYAKEIEDAHAKGVLLSLHLKATMMKVSDPVIFGHCVDVYFRDVFETYSAQFAELGVEAKNGMRDLEQKLERLPEALRSEVQNSIKEVYKKRPALAMVDSDKGITNLHVPSDVIIDASMPAAIRTSGKMWNSEGKLQDMKALIPDRSYAEIYQKVIDFCRQHGAFDPSTMGNVANVGLMAQKAEEYGSHDKTFIAPGKGSIRVVDQADQVVFAHDVDAGDIWRACQTKDEPIRDWVRLAVSRARATGAPAVFWLSPDRAHDANLMTLVETYLKEHDTNGLDISIQSPDDAMTYSLERVKAGQDTISVTGNVLRDYLTDLFPILELGTSAKMLSIVPLLKGGGLYETGAGGSAPKHVDQFVEENHLRWDSLGEFLALSVSLEDLGNKSGNAQATILASTLNQAISKHLDNNKSPSRKVGELDNRGSHFYLALYWAEALAAQTKDSSLAERFGKLAKSLSAAEEKILSELNEAQGRPAQIGGYYHPDNAKTAAAMRPSPTFNNLLDSL